MTLNTKLVNYCNTFDKINHTTTSFSEIVCSYFPESKSGQDTSGLKVQGTLHWVEASHAVTAEIRDYERLFTVPEPTADEDIDFDIFGINLIVCTKKIRLIYY